MSCERCQEQFGLYLYGELEGEREEAIEAHCAACEPCRLGLERERGLHRAFDDGDAPLPPSLLNSCRRELAAVLAAPPAIAPSGWLLRIRDWLTVSGWKPVAAFALVMAGFFGGRVSLPPPAHELLATRVRDVNTLGDGSVRLVLEETRQRTLGGSMEDDGIRQLLLAAAQDPADAGLRVESVELLRGQSTAAGVRGALIAALERDPNPGVRLKAIEGLRPFAADPQVRRVLTQALERDDNPGVRTQAVDLLIEHGPQNDMVDVLQRLMQRENNGYIRSRAQRTLEAINASVETF